jgi:hypothetical protein
MSTPPMTDASAEGPPALTCVLFLASGSPSSERARTAVQQALSNAGFSPDTLETVDVHVDPKRAMRAGAIAVPMLSVATPNESRWYAGDFTDMPGLDAFFHSLR